MDPRERQSTQEELLRMATDSAQANIWTTLPGILQSFNPVAMTAVVQPAIQRQFTGQDNKTQDVTMPLLLDCPVHFPSGGGHTLTFPLATGDEVLVVFAARCIDGWHESAAVAPQAEVRLHDLSDGFCIPKVWSRPKALSGISTAATQLRSDDGSTFIELNATTQAVSIMAPGGVVVTAPTAVFNCSTSVTINSPQTTCTGALTVGGLLTYQGGMVGSGGGTAADITGDLINNGINLHSHAHSGVQPGAGTTGGPV